MIRYLLQDVNRSGLPEFSVTNTLDHCLTMVVLKHNDDVFLEINIVGHLVLIDVKTIYHIE